MNLKSLFVISAIGIGFVLCSRIDFVWKQPSIDENVIVGQIINNFFRTYFRNNEIFIAVIVSRSENEHNHIQNDLVDLLVLDLTSAGFAYSILNQLGNNTRDNRKPFYLILVDDGEELQ